MNLIICQNEENDDAICQLMTEHSNYTLSGKKEASSFSTISLAILD